MKYIVFIIILLVILKILLRNPKHLGLVGERKVADILSSLPSEYHTINDVIVPTDRGTSQIDHIVVSPYGIFVIETKNYSGWIFGSENSNEWKETFKTTDSNLFRNPIKQNWGHIYALSDFLNYDKQYFKPIIVFSNKSTLNVESKTPVIYMGQLKREILSYTESIMTNEDVDTVYSVLKSLNDNKPDNASRNHVENVRSNLYRAKEAVSQGKCPRCGGNLVLRSGKYGKFYGCSNYPKCKYTNKN